MLLCGWVLFYKYVDENIKGLGYNSSGRTFALDAPSLSSAPHVGGGCLTCNLSPLEVEAGGSQFKVVFS